MSGTRHKLGGLVDDLLFKSFIRADHIFARLKHQVHNGGIDFVCVIRHHLNGLQQHKEWNREGLTGCEAHRVQGAHEAVERLHLQSNDIFVLLEQE